MRLELRILGPLQVFVDGEPVRLAPGKQCALMCLFAVRRGQPVLRQQVSEALWPAGPPANADKVIHLAISRLRRALGPGAPVVETVAGGYALCVADDDFDARRFERLAEKGRAALAEDRPAVALRELQSALALWRGPPLVDVAYESFAQPETNRLEELRLSAVEARIEAELRLGRHAEVIGELEQLVEEEPLREALRGQLMLALYRSERQADALAVYQDARRLLDRELGLQPGAALRRLEQRILEQDPVLTPGEPAPAPAYAVSRRELASEEMIGRDGELAELLLALTEAASGRPRVIVIAGEAGIGKTRLAGELAESASRDGYRVLWGGCVALTGETAPYLALAEALRTIQDDPLVADAPRALAGVLPGPAAPDGGDAVAPLRVFELFLRLAGRIAADRPTLLIVEDVHWVDTSTLDMLAFLARNLRDERLAIVLTFRLDEPKTAAPVRAWLAEISRLALTRWVDLERLTPQNTARQLSAILRTAVDHERASRIHARSGGIPFLTEELLSAESGAAAGHIAASVREMLMARVRALSDDSQLVVRVAAVAGNRIEHPLIAAVSGLGSQVVNRALREAVESAVVAVDPAHRRYVFRHALLQEAVYADLLPGERVECHAAVARELERRFLSGTGEDAGVAADIARHWDLADSRRAALRASIRAGFAAEAVHAPAEAARHYERAVELWTTSEDLDDTGLFDRADLLAHAAQAAGQAGFARRASDLLTEALAVVDHREDPVRASTLLHQRARFRSRAGDTIDAFADQYRCLELLPPDPSVERARALLNLGTQLVHASRHEEARRRCEEALDVAATVADERIAAQARLVLGVTFAALGDPDGGIALMRRATAELEAAGDPEDISFAHGNLSDDLIRVGCFEEGAAVALRGLEYCRSFGLEHGAGMQLLGNAVEALLPMGRWEQCDRLIADGVAQRGEGLFADTIHLLAAALALERGHLQVAADHLVAVELGHIDSEPQYACQYFEYLSRLEALQGSRPSARAAVQAGLRRVENSDDPIFAVRIAVLGVAIEADAAAEGDADAAQRALSIASRARSAVERAPAGPPPPGTRAATLMARIDAELLRAQGILEVDTWARALAAAVGWGAASETIETRLRYAEALKLSGDEDPALAELAIADATARDLGAEPLARRAERLGRRLGVTSGGERFEPSDPVDDRN